MREIKVIFKTLTPLWTGDAWGENSKIRPSSLMGSLRFWFEVICYFAGITNESDYKNGKLKGEITSEKFRKKVLELQKVNPDKSFEELEDMALASLGIPLPARIFGCTGWKSLIRIKSIELAESCCPENKLNLPYKICINKSDYTIKENNDCPNRSNGNWSVWYFSKPYFYGKFEITFEIKNENVLKNIFYPLLNFVKEYGFLGGKWNLGYGRVKVKSIEVINENWGKEKFNYSELHKEFTDFVNIKSNFRDLENKEKKVLYLENQTNNSEHKKIIKELVKIKAQSRAEIKNNRRNTGDDELRHQLFGTVKKGKYEGIKTPQGTKILPWIYEENGQLKGGFVSIAGLLNLGG